MASDSPSRHRTTKVQSPSALNLVKRAPTQAIVARVAGSIGTAMLEAIDQAAERRWPRALDLAGGVDGTLDERLDEISQRFLRELTGMGAASGAAAAVPGVGTAATAATLTAEIGWLALRSADLIMTIGAIHGHLAPTVEERRSWVLAVLAYGDDAARELHKLQVRLGEDYLNESRTAGLGRSRDLPHEVRDRINATLSANLLKKYGARRGIASFGRLLPFGIGAAIGGGTNWSFVRTITRQADQFFGELRVQVEAERLATVHELAPPRAGGLAGGINRLRRRAR